MREIERALEEYVVLQGQAAPPPAAPVLDRVLDQVRGERAETALPAGKVSQAKSGSSPVLVWALAIALILAVAAVAYLLSQSQQRGEALSQSEQRLITLQADCEEIREQNQDNLQQLAVLSDAETRNIVLAGSENAPDSRAVVFYNPVAGQTLFSPANLPAPPAGKQYQLWAIDANGPQDLGVLDRNIASGSLLDVAYLPGVAAFAITLEDEGGKPQPDLSQLQVIGEVGT
nr:anti-sigma factor [Lewinella sp. JB7]